MKLQDEPAQPAINEVPKAVDGIAGDGAVIRGPVAADEDLSDQSVRA